MLIIISGFAGSGKSTLTEELAEYFKMEFVHASDLLHQMKSKEPEELDVKHTHRGSGFWESEEGHKYLHKREKDSSMDRELDELLLKVAEHGNVILDSWTMPWLCKTGFKIWLETDPMVRAKRVAHRDKLDEAPVLERILERDKITAQIYEKLYNFKMEPDEKVFDLIINNFHLKKEEVFDIAVEKIKEKLNND